MNKNSSAKFQMIKNNKKKLISLSILLILIVTGAYYSSRELPEGFDYQSAKHNIPADDIRFLADLTYENSEGEKIYEQSIFDTIFSYIEKAEKYILIDMFLFNSYKTNPDEFHYRNLSGELTLKLIKKIQEKPDIKIDFITDPINIVYGGTKTNELESLKNSGINVIVTDLNRLRDSNLIYSPIWRVFFKWLGNSNKAGFLKNPFSFEEQKISLRSYLRLLNFKANHRKVFIADSEDEVVSVIMSANPHNGSSAHSNVAISVKGDIWKDIYNAEIAVAKISSKTLQQPQLESANKEGNVTVQLLTESKIKSNLISLINKTNDGDKISIAMFYLSERSVVKSLLGAADRGVTIKIILDPNKDAFGYKKIGVPNRQVAGELIKKSKGKIDVKWYETNGEQFHTKMVLIESVKGPSAIMLGSANLTRRNIKNFNLETDILITADFLPEPIKNSKDYFYKIWHNIDGNYTVDFAAYEDDSLLKRIIYVLQEYLGLSSF